MKKIKDFFKKINKKHSNLFLIVGIFFFVIYKTLFATTPNPGHPWSEVGDGVFQVTGPTVMRTYTLPDATTTILTTNAAVTVAQGGTGLTSLTQGDILYASASNTLSALAKDTNATRYLGTTGVSFVPTWLQPDISNTGYLGSNILDGANGGTGNGFTSFSSGPTALRTYTLPDASTTILTTNAVVTLAQGGTNNASLTASNGGIVYSTSTNLAILAGTATAGQILRSGSSAAPSWSTATYPATAGTSGNFLVSDGTNWVSTAPATVVTVLNQPFIATGNTGNAATNTGTTSRRVGLFALYSRIVINQVTFTVTAIGGTSPSYTTKVCIYNEAGSSKLLDVTSAAITATGTYSTTVSPAVTLDPGNYYMVSGNASVSGTSPTLSYNRFGTTAASFFNGASVPSGKTIYEGTVSHTSGTCNSTLGTITAANNSDVIVRMDN